MVNSSEQHTSINYFIHFLNSSVRKVIERDLKKWIGSLRRSYMAEFRLLFNYFINVFLCFVLFFIYNYNF